MPFLLLIGFYVGGAALISHGTGVHPVVAFLFLVVISIFGPKGRV